MADATQTGATKPARSARTDIYNQIAEKRIDEFNKELKEAGSDDRLDFVPTELDPDTDPDDVEAEAARKALNDKAAAAEGELDTGKPESAPIYEFLGEEDLGKTKVKIKVDGEEQEIAVADLVKNAQKNGAADKRLREAAHAKQEADAAAAETLRRANAEAEDIRARAKTGQAGEGEAPAGKKGSPSTQDAIKSAVAALYEGDQDKAAEELGKVIDGNRRGDPTTDRSQLKAELKTELKTESAWDSALATFSADHPEIVSDEEALEDWQRLLDKAALTSTTPAEAIQKATDKLLAKAARLLPDQAGGNRVTVEGEALQRRAAGKTEAAKHMASSSTSQRAPRSGRAEEKPLTGSQIIEEMKRLRGQSS